MDYGMNEEQKMIQDLAKKIAVEKALPLREELDISGEFPWPVVKALAESNLTGIGIEEKYEGIGKGVFEYCIVTEQLSIICGGIALAFAATGLELDHVNAHKHFHLHPTIAALIVRIGRPFGMKAMRVPYEPAKVLRQIEPGAGGDFVVELWARRLRRRLKAAGIFSPDRVFGLAWSGAMTTARLAGLLAHLPEGVSEIYLHPATGPGYPGATQGYLYEQELAALTSNQVIDLIKENEVNLGSFADFLPRGEGSKVGT